MTTAVSNKYKDGLTVILIFKQPVYSDEIIIQRNYI